MYYKYETHSHTLVCSDCGRGEPEDMVKSAKESGLSGMVLTNHFYHGNTCIDRDLPWTDFVKAYEDDYLRAKECAEKLDFDVFFGLEEVYHPGKEILIYGISPSVVAGTPEFRDMNLVQMKEFVNGNGGIIAAAHPFRRRGYIPDPDYFPGLEYFDAVEIYNQANTPEDNYKAEVFFRNTGARLISGSDIHETFGFGYAGIAFTERVREPQTLVNKIMNGEYRLIVNGEII